MLERHYRELLNFCARMMRNKDMAADVVQESYARVLAVAAGGLSHPRALLFKTARNVMIDLHRREQSRPQQGLDGSELELEDSPVSRPDVQLESSQAVQAMLASIQAMPRRRREAFILHRFDGLSHEEIAQRMGISRSMVEQHVRLAMLACRQSRRQYDQISGLSRDPNANRRGPRE